MCGAGHQTLPLPGEEQKGWRHPSPLTAPLTHIWRCPQRPGSEPAAWNPFLVRPPAPRPPRPRGTLGPPSPGEQHCAVLQRAAAHRPPALPDQLGLQALHARPGARGARLVPSGHGHRHRTCRAISAATQATVHPLRPLRLVRAGSNCHSFSVLGGGTPTLPAPLAPLGTLLRLLHPAPRGSERAPPRATRLGRFKATAAPAPLCPSRRASLGYWLWPETTRCHGKCPGFTA